MEELVLGGWQPSAVRPWIIVVEGTLPLTHVDSHGRWESLILEMGYKPVYFDGLNLFYLSQSELELEKFFQISPNIFDEFVLSGRGSATFCELLTDELDVIQAENKQLAAQLEGQRGKATRLAMALEATRADGKRLAQTIVEREREITDMRLHVEQSKRREKEVGVELQGKQEEATRLAAALEAAREDGKRLAQTIVEREREIADERLHLEQIQKEAVQLADALIARERELGLQIQSIQGRVDSLLAELKAVYTSRSWRITGSIRLVSTLTKRMLFGASRMVRILGSLPTHTGKRAIAAIAVYLRAHPRRKARVIRMLARWPRVVVALRRYATPQSASLVSAPGHYVDPTSETEGSVDWGTYPSAVRENYRALVTACAQSATYRSVDGA